MVILEFDFKSLDDKIVNSVDSLLKTQDKREIHFWGVTYLLRAF